MKPATVVLGWAGLNTVLMLAMLAYGEDGRFIALYGLGVVLIAAAGGVVWLATHLRGTGRLPRLSVSSRSAGYFALAVLLALLAFVYGYWFGAAAFAFLIMSLLHLPGERFPAGVEPAPTSVPTVSPERTRAPAAIVRPVKAITGVAVTMMAARSVFRALVPSRRRRVDDG